MVLESIPDFDVGVCLVLKGCVFVRFDHAMQWDITKMLCLNKIVFITSHIN